ncbi:MAG TPA: PepSY domain-containing protein [Bacillus sp. (in: firmicutes)]|nr:PepSY domain-containing protein [Bacillus sp. (in: firmicutes)]
MKNRKRLVIIGSILAIGLFVFIGLQSWAPSLSAQTLTEEEAKKVAMDKYRGDIIKTTKTNDHYQVDMQLKTGIYHIRIDAENGEVISITRESGSKAKEEPPLVETPQKETPKERLTEKEIEAQLSSQGHVESIEYVEEKETSYYKAVVSSNNGKRTLKLDPFTGAVIDSSQEAASIITENEAIVIAEKHVNGTGDDAEFFHPDGETPYYIVDVELDDDREAEVQVDAYTRAVKSVIWEDNHDDDNE